MMDAMSESGSDNASLDMDKMSNSQPKLKAAESDARLRDDSDEHDECSAESNSIELQAELSLPSSDLIDLQPESMKIDSEDGISK